MDMTGTHIRYLLAMYQLSHECSEMRLTEIAKTLNVKKASVARIMGIFQQKELVTQQLYGKIQFTTYGRTLVEQYHSYAVQVEKGLMDSGLHLTKEEAEKISYLFLSEFPERYQISNCEKVVDN